MKFSLATTLALVFAILPAAAQQPAAAPKPKSQKEVDALKKVQADAQASNYDQEIQDVNFVLENFADTDYKEMLLNMAMDAAQRKGDMAQTVTFGERVIQVNPNDFSARVMMAETIAAHMRENDLDKDQNTKKVEEYSNKALELLKSTSTPPPGVAEAQWPDYKKQLTSQAYDALGQVNDVNKKYPDAVTNFKAAIDAQPANSVAYARLAKAYADGKQYDDAISTADKVLAMADAPPQVKQFAQQQKDAATKLKATAK